MKLSAFSSRSLRALLVGAVWLAIGSSLAVAQAVFSRGQVGVPYSFQVVTNPASPSGTVYGATNLPAGLSINSATGVISGTPTTAGTSNGVISLAFGGVTNNPAYTITIDAALGTPVVSSATT